MPYDNSGTIMAQPRGAGENVLAAHATQTKSPSSREGGPLREEAVRADPGDSTIHLPSEYSSSIGWNREAGGIGRRTEKMKPEERIIPAIQSSCA